MTTDAATRCSHCGQPPHPGICPTIKAIEYYENGMVKRVEYRTAADNYPPIVPLPATPQPAFPPWSPTWSGAALQTELDVSRGG